MLRIGAVAYAPYVVTIFEGLKRHFHREGVELDWVLYSNYDALVTAFVNRRSRPGVERSTGVREDPARPG